MILRLALEWIAVSWCAAVPVSSSDESPRVLGVVVPGRGWVPNDCAL